MSKTIIAVRHFGLGGRESLETAVSAIIFHWTLFSFAINLREPSKAYFPLGDFAHLMQSKNKNPTT